MTRNENHYHSKFSFILNGMPDFNEKTQLKIEQPSIRKDSQDIISCDELKQDI